MESSPPFSLWRFFSPALAHLHLVLHTQGWKRKGIEIKIFFFFFFFLQITLNPELSPGLIHTAATSIDAMENMVLGRNKMTRMLLLVVGPFFSRSSCMWRSSLKTLSVPSYAWDPPYQENGERLVSAAALAGPICCRRQQWMGGRHGSEWTYLPSGCLQQIHTWPQQLKVACLSFFAVSFLSVSKALIPKMVYDAVVCHRSAQGNLVV